MGMLKLNRLEGYIIVDSECNPFESVYESFFDAVNNAACLLCNELDIAVDDCDVSLAREQSRAINSKMIFKTEIKGDTASKIEYVSSVVVRKKED